MKKVSLVVPDQIEHFVGSSLRSRTALEDVYSVNFKQALCDRDHYNEYYWSESPDKVEVISIEEYNDNENGDSI